MVNNKKGKKTSPTTEPVEDLLEVPLDSWTPEGPDWKPPRPRPE